MDDYKNLYFEELKEGNELRQKLEDTQKALSTLKSTFLITLYTILCIFLAYTHTNVTDTLFKFFGCLLMLVPILLISNFLNIFILADYNNFTTKGKVLTIVLIIVAVPVITYFAFTGRQ